MSGVKDVPIVVRGKRAETEGPKHSLIQGWGGPAPPLPSSPWAHDYFEARWLFRALTAARGATQVWYETVIDAATSNPVLAPNGDPLTVDFAVFEPPAPRRVTGALVHVSGTHGAEAFCGSAIQCAFLGLDHPFLQATLQRGVGILFIHGLNPYGFSWLRRANENNVDINRNCFARTYAPHATAGSKPPSAHHHAAVRAGHGGDARAEDEASRSDKIGGVYPSAGAPAEVRCDLAKGLTPYRARGTHPVYAALFSFLNPPPSVAASRLHLIAGLGVAGARYGPGGLRRSINMGQDTHPQGLFFGGERVEGSSAALFRAVARVAARWRGVARAVCLDVHSGLGECATDTILVDEERDLDAARGVFGRGRCPRHEPSLVMHLEPPNTGGGVEMTCDPRGVAYVVEGLVAAAVRAMLEGAGGATSTLCVQQEFGTYPSTEVLHRLRHEHAVWRDAARRGLPPVRPEHPTRQALKEAFAPASAAWRFRVVELGRDALRRCLNYVGDSAPSRAPAPAASIIALPGRRGPLAAPLPVSLVASPPPAAVGGVSALPMAPAAGYSAAGYFGAPPAPPAVPTAHPVPATSPAFAPSVFAALPVGAPWSGGCAGYLA